MSEPQPRGGTSADIPTGPLAAATVLILAVLAAVVYLTATGKDVSNVLLVLSSLIAPTIASLVAIRKLTDVQQKVNGKIDNLVKDKANLEHQVSVAGFTPVTASVSFDPESTGPMEAIAGIRETEPPTNPYHVSEVLRRLQSEETNHHGRQDL